MFCQCGCGGVTPIAKRHRAEWGYRKGEHVPYLRGHNARTSAPEGMKVCRTCENVLPIAQFYVTPGSGKRRGTCLECAAIKRAAYRDRNRDALRERARGRRHDPEKNRRRARRWVLENPERAREQRRMDAARRRGAPFSAEGKEWALRVLLADPCAYCGMAAGTIDHISPVSAGGTSHWSNLAGACLACNSGKGARPLLWFLLRRADVRSAA